VKKSEACRGEDTTPKRACTSAVKPIVTILKQVEGGRTLKRFAGRAGSPMHPATTENPNMAAETGKL